MREKKHPRQKEWERLQQREALLLRRRRKEDGSFLEELLSDKVPQGLEQTLNKAFAKAFGLPPPDGDAAEIINTMLKRSGLKQYVVFLQSAANLATHQKKEISWDYFVTAYDKIQSLNQG